jgi:hypothetical protein
MMGGMGRTFDGGYAEFTCVPVGQAVPFASDLDWATLGAVPEMLQTSFGSLTVGLDALRGAIPTGLVRRPLLGHRRSRRPGSATGFVPGCGASGHRRSTPYHGDMELERT